MRRDRRSSLLAALFGRMGALVLLIILAVGSAAFITAQRRVDEVYDGQLIIGANVLRALMSEELRREGAAAPDSTELQVDDTALLSPEDRQAFDNFADWRMFRVWRGQQLVLRSDTGPKVGQPPDANGFSQAVEGRDQWRVYTLHVPAKPVVVQVGERLDIRRVLVRSIALGLVLPLLLLLPIAGVLLWLSLRDGLRALRQLVTEIGGRTGRDLAPLPLTPWPRDLDPLVRSINRLLGRIEQSRQHERRFIDDAAHQLRTPLAAMKLQAQLVAEETSPEERAAASAQLVEGVDRAAHMTERLLMLARLEAGPGGASRGDLREETVAAIADLAALAARREIELSYEGEGAFPSGEPLLLRLIAANLLENAIHHAPAGSEVAVRLSRHPGGQELSVSDTGPGIPPDERRKVVARFYRGRQAVGSGSGLGLAIVAEAVRLLGGRLELLDRPDGARGLWARVQLPEKAAPEPDEFDRSHQLGVSLGG